MTYGIGRTLPVPRSPLEIKNMDQQTPEIAYIKSSNKA
jgi:hypothetical protein